MFPQRAAVWSPIPPLGFPAMARSSAPEAPRFSRRMASLLVVRYAAAVFPKSGPTLTIIAGFLLGFSPARREPIVAPATASAGPIRTIAVIVDWTAPPLAGGLVAAAFFVAQRYKRLHDAERAASRVLAERLAGTERRQAIWVVAAAIAHDLKNPLHNVQLLLEEA